MINKITIKASTHFHAGKDGIGGFMSNVVASIMQVTEISQTSTKTYAFNK